MASPTTLYEFYTSLGASLPSVAARAHVYENLGLGSAENYTGTASQNTALLGLLTQKSEVPPPSTPPSITPAPPPPTVPAPSQPDPITGLTRSMAPEPGAVSGDPLAIIEQYKAELSGITLRELMDLFTPASLNDLIGLSGLTSADLNATMNWFRSFPPSMSLYQVLKEQLLGMQPSLPADPAPTLPIPDPAAPLVYDPAPAPAKWDSSFDSSGFYVADSPTYEIDEDSSSWSIPNVTINGYSASELKYIAGKNWRELKEQVGSAMVSKFINDVATKALGTKAAYLLLNSYQDLDDGSSLSPILERGAIGQLNNLDIYSEGIFEDRPVAHSLFESTATDWMLDLMQSVFDRTGIVGSTVWRLIPMRIVERRSEETNFDNSAPFNGLEVPQASTPKSVSFSLQDANSPLTAGVGSSFRVVAAQTGDSFTGGSGNDLLVGLGGSDTIGGGGGNDWLLGGGGTNTLDGGTGRDVAAFAGNAGVFNVDVSRGNFVISGSDGSQTTLINIERIHFDDIGVALDTDGNGGMAYRLYQAAFNRTPDRAGLGYQIDAMDDGLSLTHVAANFIASPEFQATYGSLNYTQFVTQLYANVLHRAPDSEGLSFHTKNLGNGMTSAQVLAGFSESPENKAALIGTISRGMVYEL